MSRAPQPYSTGPVLRDNGVARCPWNWCAMGVRHHPSSWCNCGTMGNLGALLMPAGWPDTSLEMDATPKGHHILETFIAAIKTNSPLWWSLISLYSSLGELTAAGFVEYVPAWLHRMPQPYSNLIHDARHALGVRPYKREFNICMCGYRSYIDRDGRERYDGYASGIDPLTLVHEQCDPGLLRA